THLTNIEDATSRFPSRAAFKIPQVNPETDEIDHWTDITFRQLLLDIELLARYWFHVLKESSGIPQRSVIALCLGGYKYLDIVHLYAISRAGYIPLLINIFPNADYSVIQGRLNRPIPVLLFMSRYITIPSVIYLRSPALLLSLLSIRIAIHSPIYLMSQDLTSQSFTRPVGPPLESPRLFPSTTPGWIVMFVKITKALTDSGKVDIGSWR
ncbi:hypothetical protein BDP27DRAFT_1474805, partial [Rhodocollybia butyracea]